SAIKSGLPMPFTSISAGWIFTLMGLLDDGRPLNQGKSQKQQTDEIFGLAVIHKRQHLDAEDIPRDQ
ncbi:hypothetical protein, partial [Thiolapillus sp.]|uniref:hypothetical protein n=2 Tax=Thiolapillus sp. TaxID=2017437 RepID=UPI0025DE0123